MVKKETRIQFLAQFPQFHYLPSLLPHDPPTLHEKQLMLTKISKQRLVTGHGNYIVFLLQCNISLHVFLFQVINGETFCR